MSEEKRKISNEKAALRMQIMRARKKQQKREAALRPQEAQRPNTRAEEERKKKQQEAWKRQKRNWRASLHPQKKRRLNEKRRAKYSEKKAARKAQAECNNDQGPARDSELMNDSRSDAAKRKALQRARQSLPKEPFAFADTVCDVVATCSPRKQAALAD